MEGVPQSLGDINLIIAKEVYEMGNKKFALVAGVGAVSALVVAVMGIVVPRVVDSILNSSEFN